MLGRLRPCGHRAGFHALLPEISLTDGRETFEIKYSSHLPVWLAEQGISLAFSTYQAGKLFFIGHRPDGRLSVFERTFARCMGLWSNGQTLWMGSLYQLWRFENALLPGQRHDGHDRLFVPRLCHVTGDVDSHDIGIDANGKPIFVNTLFNCLAAPSETHSFAPVWRPPFITGLVPEDRCHLNGLAMKEGQPAFVTAVGISDTGDGWRRGRRGGGVVIDVATNEIIANGLSMPHSPRLHREQLWLLNSGTGELGTVDVWTGRFNPVCFCPGYGRGLALWGDYAIVGLSQARRNRTFNDLPLGEALTSRGTSDRCGLVIVDITTGEIVQWLTISGVVEELYDVVALPGCARPAALGLRNEEIHHHISIA